MSVPAFWDRLYAEGQDGWELGEPAPPLVAWLEAGGRFAAPDGSRPARLAIPGSGRGHDARLLARHGYRAWGFDFAAAAVAQAVTLAEGEGADVTFEQRDVFTLGEAYAGFFDGVWEYTCFCAIDPARRQEYARTVRAVLRPGGMLLACFYPLREGDAGPPFPVTEGEIEAILAPHFRICESGPPPASAARRQGLERLVRAERRG